MNHDACQSLSLHCPAKINLALAVGPPTETGMHPIASWMVALGLGDTLHLEPCDVDTPDEQRFAVAYADDAPRPGVVDWPREQDLAWRALERLERHAGQRLPVALRIDKRVPTGAGCGGGSSDAAAVLVGVSRACGVDLSPRQLVAMGLELGSDVGFAVHALTGEPSVLVTGAGDVFEPVPLHEPLAVTLVLPELSCPTGPVYWAFDQLRPNAGPANEAGVRRVVSTLLNGSDRCGPFNDLEAAAVAVTPELVGVLHALRDTLRLPAHVTGSGAACFCIADSTQQAEHWAQQVRERLGIAALATRTLTATWSPVATD